MKFLKTHDWKTVDLRRRASHAERVKPRGAAPAPHSRSESFGTNKRCKMTYPMPAAEASDVSASAIVSPHTTLREPTEWGK